MKREEYKTGLPAGYKRLEYIMAQRGPYIDTLYYPSSNTELVCDFQIVPNENMTSIIGSRDGTTTNGYHLTGYNNIGTNVGHFLFGSTRYYGCVRRDGSKQLVEISDKKVYLDGELKVELPTTEFTTRTTLVVCATHEVNAVFDLSYATIYYIKISELGEVQREFVPALRMSDNKPGLYDLCESVCPLTGTPFYINAGTGEFLYE